MAVLMLFVFALHVHLVVSNVKSDVINSTHNVSSDIIDMKVRIRRASTTVKLVGGHWPWEGRLLITGTDGNYGAMCAEMLTKNDRDVICKNLFYERFNMFGYAANSSMFGGDLDPRVLNVAPKCKGDEKDVTDCPGFASIWSDRSVCSKGQAAIVCISDLGIIFTHPQHRPVTEGRPEVYYYGSWGTICNKGITQREITMLCTFNQYWTSFGKMVPASQFGNSHHPTKIQNLHCVGDEPSIDYCAWENSTCSHDLDVGISCEKRHLDASDITLTGGAQPWKGRFEVHLTNRNITASVCGGDMWFSPTDAVLVCRSMGFSKGGKTLPTMPVSPTAPNIMLQLYCVGFEPNIGECAGRWIRDSNDCPTFPPQVGAVDCTPDGLEVKVTAGKLPFEGTVQILSNGRWSTVDSTSVKENEAKTICSTMGFQETTPKIFPADHFRFPGYLPIISLRCPSYAFHIGQCDVKRAANQSATHAGIHCFDCGLQYYGHDSGVITSDNYPGGVTGDVDCLYHIKTTGKQQRYRFYFTDLNLGNDGHVTIREDPMDLPLSSISGNQGPSDVIFTKDLYIRFKAPKGAKFQFNWETYTGGRKELEEAVSAQCTPDAITASVDLPKLKAAFANTDASHLYLGDVTCTGVTHGNTWSATANHGSCKTQRQVDDVFIVYKTSVVYSLPGTNPGAYITEWSVAVDCAFKRNTTAKTNSSIINESSNAGVNTTSHYSAVVRIFSDKGLHNEVKGQPIRVKLGSDMYAEVAFSANFRASLKLQDCSLKDNPTNPTGYDLIRNGCPVDSDTSIIAETSSATVFHFKAIEFVAGVTSVYLTCDVTYCLPNDNSQACNHQCSTTPHGRRQEADYSRNSVRVAKKFDMFL